MSTCRIQTNTSPHDFTWGNTIISLYINTYTYLYPLCDSNDTQQTKSFENYVRNSYKKKQNFMDWTISRAILATVQSMAAHGITRFFFT
jgi:hypothetical protein